MTKREAIAELESLTTSVVDRDMIDSVCERVIEYLEGLEDDDDPCTYCQEFDCVGCAYSAKGRQ